MEFNQNDNTSFDENDADCYSDKEFFNPFFQDDLFGKNGLFFFPGTFEEASEIVQELYTVQDLEEFFSMYEYPLSFENKFNNWSCSTLACSALYYYLNTSYKPVDLELQSRDNIRMSAYDWKIICYLLHSPIFGQNVFSFVIRHQLIDYSLEKNILQAVKWSLVFPPYIYVQNKVSKMPRLTTLFRLLKFTQIEKEIIHSLIRTTFAEQTPKKVIYYLNDLINT